MTMEKQEFLILGLNIQTFQEYYYIFLMKYYIHYWNDYKKAVDNILKFGIQ